MKNRELLEPMFPGHIRTGERPLRRTLAEKMDFILQGGLIFSGVGGAISYAFSTMPGPERYTTFLHSVSTGLLSAAVVFGTAYIATRLIIWGFESLIEVDKLVHH
ncbi:MAG: hypothetical protein G01um10147_1008 [Microgenomates group bacterium Gr01-1014_7]|nr:MAG: hypothetical protein G01um10147_1008 [Microgenomates group bacterium Gr01-1014_7]